MFDFIKFQINFLSSLLSNLFKRPLSKTATQRCSFIFLKIQSSQIVIKHVILIPFKSDCDKTRDINTFQILLRRESTIHRIKHFFRYMWWGLFNLRPHLSEEDELKEKKNQLIREIKEKKLRIKKLKQARKEQRAERFR